MASYRTLTILAFVTGALAFCFLILPYIFFPQFYIPKGNPSMGYTGAATVEGWAFMIIGFCLLAITVVLAKIFRPRKMVL